MGPTRNMEPRADWLTLYKLIERMAPWQRTLWVEKCCVLASRGSYPVTLKDCRGEVDECWQCYRTLCGQGRLDADSAGRLAASIVNGRR